MSYSTCQLCGRLFEMKEGRYCSDKCYKKDSEEYQRLREYVQEHQGVTAMEASKVTGVSMKSIMRYVEQGWISTIEEQGKLSFEHFADQFQKARQQEQESGQKRKSAPGYNRSKDGERFSIRTNK